MRDLTMNRRDFMAFSASGVGLTASGVGKISFRSERSIIQIVMTGGPGAIDTWDPKPNVPVERRSPFQPIATRVPGVYFSELFPRLAERADQLSLIRTLYHSEPPLHETGLQLLQTGGVAQDDYSAPPHIGAVLSCLTESKGEAPPWVILSGPLGDTGVDLPQGQSSGDLAVEVQPDYLPAIPLENVPARYGGTSFGVACYQAVRLVTAGVRVVTINMFPGVFNQESWDMHASSRRLAIAPRDYRDRLGPMFDHAFSSMIDELISSGHGDRTLVMAAGEVGRTPWFNRHGGRDHWAGCWSMLLAGGGMAGGRVLGESDRFGADPLEAPVHPSEVVATAYHFLGIPRGTMLPRKDGSIRPISTARPLVELF